MQHTTILSITKTTKKHQHKTKITINQKPKMAKSLKINLKLNNSSCYLRQLVNCFREVKIQLSQ